MAFDRFTTPVPTQRDDTQRRTHALETAISERILVMDGATGTFLQGVDLTPDDFGGVDLDGCNENLNRLRPDIIGQMHRGYLKAGADIVETNTFGATPLVLDEYALGKHAFELNKLAAEIARKACAGYETADRLRFVCGSMGPTTKSLAVTGGLTFDELITHYEVQALGLMAGGADYLLLETCQDMLNVKAGLIAIHQAYQRAGWRLPIAVSATIETMGTMLAGQDADSAAVALMHENLLYLGLNCATGPDLMTDHIRSLAELTQVPVSCVPNAGLPNEDGLYEEGPEVFERVIGRFLQSGWLNVIGGCCGTTNGHVQALAQMAQQYEPRRPKRHHRALVSGLESVELDQNNRPLLVGERTNVLGSRRFKRLIQSGDYEAAAEIGRRQVKRGGQILDICLQDPDRDEAEDMDQFLQKLIRRVKVPLMIDTTDPDVMERALKWCQGKSVLNSINLEDGLERFDAVVPLAKKYGCAVVVGCIDETGMAVTAEEKLAVAQRSYDLLTQKYGIAPADIWWDALVFPCGTGDENYLGSAAQTIEGVRQLKVAFPHCKTVLGVSNVSFGLPGAGREVLNAVFLYHCTKAGLDAALVNTQKLARYAEIGEKEKALADALIFLPHGDKAAGEAAVSEFTAFFRGKKHFVGPEENRRDLPLEKRIARAIIEGSKEGLVDDLDEALKDERWPQPLDIINGPLMAGMGEVGRLFNDNQLIVAEVLQSAEVMKTAVNHLENFMEKSEGSRRAKVLLATVKGDVHDIGKNLVDIILSNNGFDVVNLGIKVPNEVLINAVKEHRPDIIGLSGLLVKSAQQMIVAAEDLAAVGIDTPLLVGGAALTRRFTHRRIAAKYKGICTYAKDAMSGLSLIERLSNDDLRPSLEEEIAEIISKDAEAAKAKAQSAPRIRPAKAPVNRNIDRLTPQNLNRHEIQLDLDEVWSHLNPQMLYGKHLGLRGNIQKLAAAGDGKFLELEALIRELQDAGRDGAMAAKAVYQLFPVESKGNRVTLFDPQSGNALGFWDFPRQLGENGRCIADYILDSDHIGLFATSAGYGIREQSQKWKESGAYLKSHAWAALALESAEAAAEVVHAKIRELWGFADTGADLTPQARLKARYRGIRYSFGYPACPDLAGQRLIWEVLRPQEVGITLTEGDMMEPEASVSALVVHHPDAGYFSTD